MKATNTTLFAILLLGTVHSILLRSKTSTRISSSFSLDSPQQHFPSRFQSKLFGIKNDNGVGETSSNNDGTIQTVVDESEQKWELMEDWILQDKVPDFTVCGSTSTTSKTTIATFWRQLKHTIPELSTRTERELQDRYNVLAAAPVSESTARLSPKTNGEKAAIGTPFVSCGESPEVLTNWWMDVVEKKSGNSVSNTIMMIHGRLSNGSNIWFPLQSAGTVGADKKIENNDENESGFEWLQEDGDFIKYAESSAGCIYELGTPKPGAMTTMFDTTNSSSNDNNIEKKELYQTNILALDQTKEWLSSSTTSMGMTLSAVVSTSVLSAFLAFTAGQASLPSQTTTTSPSPSPATTTVIARPSKSSAIVPRQSSSLSSQAVTPAVLGSGMKYERTIQRDGSVKVVELSIGEQRASQELKVYRDERRLVNVQERLEADKLSLKELTQKESEIGPEAAAEPLVAYAPRSPRELSISEQRARAELKIGSDKRRIVKMKENLSNDKTKLKELQLQEKQQQQRFFLGGGGGRGDS